MTGENRGMKGVWLGQHGGDDRRSWQGSCEGEHPATGQSAGGWLIQLRRSPALVALAALALTAGAPCFAADQEQLVVSGDTPGPI